MNKKKILSLKLPFFKNELKAISEKSHFTLIEKVKSYCLKNEISNLEDIDLKFLCQHKNYKQLFEQIEKIKLFLFSKQINCLLVIGIGGSYAGTKAIYDLFPNQVLKLYFLGYNLSPQYFRDVYAKLSNLNFAILVVSKSGTTLETLKTFNIIVSDLKNIGKFDNKKIIIVSENNSFLFNLAKKNNYHFFEFPKEIGGRYSIFTVSSLLPLAFLNFKVDEFIDGAFSAQKDFKNLGSKDNLTVKYALLRNYFFQSNYHNEVFVSFEPRLRYFFEWLKQLFAESEGKEGKGLWPTHLLFSADLHSFGQMIQDGTKNIFETLINFESIDFPQQTKKFIKNSFNFNNEKELMETNKIILNSITAAHAEKGNVPIILLELKKINEISLGYLAYFFMKTCILSAIMLEVNPFDQPGVEVYKREMKKISSS